VARIASEATLTQQRRSQEPLDVDWRFYQYRWKRVTMSEIS
jgi:hypothetical protein